MNINVEGITFFYFPTQHYNVFTTYTFRYACELIIFTAEASQSCLKAENLTFYFAALLTGRAFTFHQSCASPTARSSFLSLT